MARQQFVQWDVDSALDLVNWARRKGLTWHMWKTVHDGAPAWQVVVYT